MKSVPIGVDPIQNRGDKKKLIAGEPDPYASIV